MRTHSHLVAILLFASPCVAFTQSFAKISITPSTATSSRESRLQILPTGDLIAHAIPIVDLISLAYAVPSNLSPRLSQLPDWTVRQHFDIEANVPTSLHLDSKDVASQTRIIRQLLQTLLTQRFGLIIKSTTERMPVYALTIVEGNIKLDKASITSSDCIFDTSPQGCHSFAGGFGHPLNANAVDMSDLVHYLENWTDLPVVNATTLTGLFTMHSPGWKPINLPPPPPGSASSGTEFESLQPLSTTLGAFGLQLVRQEQSLPRYTIERIHPPNTI